MSMLCDELDLLDDLFAEMFVPDATDVVAAFITEAPPTQPPPLPVTPAESMEFDLRTPSRWSALPCHTPVPTVVSLAPHLVVHDADAALAFYVRAFGATETYREVQPDGRVGWVAVAVGGVSMVICDDLPELRFGRSASPANLGGTPVTLHLAVNGVEAFFLRAVQSGARILQGLQSLGAGRSHGVVEDPFGHRWSLSSAFA